MKQEKNALDKVLKIFSEIDERIMLLHQCSSEDFLSLNKSLKENYEKARFITDKANTAYDRIGEEGNIKTLELLKNNFDEFQKDLIEFETETDFTLASMERIQSNFSLMFVPLNNFKQNLVSLKLLLSNIKLTNTFFDKSIKSFNEGEAQQIEKIINKVKDSCPVFEENIYNIQKHVKGLYDELTAIKDSVLDNIQKNFEIMKRDFDIIEKHNKHALKNKDRLEEITQNCNKSVGSIITNLQYHDIIRQKMEHIQKTHKFILEEINTEDIDTKTTTLPLNSYVLQIPQISEIQVGQLMHTNKEYQHAIEHISKKMVEIGKDMTEVVRICKALNVFEYKGKMVEAAIINESFRNFTKASQESLTKYANLSDDLSHVNSIISNLYEKYQDIDMMESAIEQRIIDKISFGNLLVSPEKETATQAQQILKLYAANHFEKNKIKTLFENTRVELKEFICRNMEYTQDRKGIDRLTIQSNDAVTYFDSIGENMNYLDHILEELATKSNEINKTSQQVVEGVKYYDCFEKSIEYLIRQFEEISSIIRSQRLTTFANINSKKSLEQIEKYYTMKSERIVHSHSLMNSVKSGNYKSVDLVLEQSIKDEEEGNDVEFF